ncbi:hypothetical protein [Corallococcus exercitus]|nr:hypothetical protein [Corallococcus exercitus]
MIMAKEKTKREKRVRSIRHVPLSSAYLGLLTSCERLQLLISGKDPFPTDPIGIPFCKGSWREQFDDTCSGGIVLQALGFTPEALQARFTTPADCFMRLVDFGIGFINLSYHFLDGAAREADEAPYLKSAAEINKPLLAKAERVLLCGEAAKMHWYAGTRPYDHIVCHPDRRNAITERDEIRMAWQATWAPGKLVQFYRVPVARILAR